jgi:nucleoside 2-deoxyribosyltransferase
MRFYIASPFFNKTQLEKVEKVESILKYLSEYDEVEYFSPRLSGCSKLFGELKTSNQKDELKFKLLSKIIFENNVRQLLDTDYLILLDEKDAGTLFELGVFLTSNNFNLSKIIDLTENFEYFIEIIKYNIEGVKILNDDLIINRHVNPKTLSQIHCKRAIVLEDFNHYYPFYVGILYQLRQSGNIEELILYKLEQSEKESTRNIMLSYAFDGITYDEKYMDIDYGKLSTKSESLI